METNTNNNKLIDEKLKELNNDLIIDEINKENECFIEIKKPSINNLQTQFNYQLNIYQTINYSINYFT